MRLTRYVLVIGATATVMTLGIVPASARAAAAAPSAPTGVRPNATSQMDCNGLSPKYKPVKKGMGGLCADPMNVSPTGATSRVEDNGRYIGHDEPSVKFISQQAGSGNDMTYFMRLAVDPKARPTTTSPRVSKYAELSPAPWFGLPMCDPNSYPLNPCTPDSDTNSGDLRNPAAAGSAFMELQFYPPGFAPFFEGPSCDPTRYCAALNIDSLSCTFGFAVCNNNCFEPVNFAYLQRDGVPAGPPSPQLTDLSTFTPNRRTLMMNQGDVLQVTIRDTAHGLLTRIHDFTTGQTGSIVASGANGFMTTNPTDCTGTPFDFHPEYSTARQQNQVPWAALEGGVLMEDEIGHFEPCSSVSDPLPIDATFPDGQSFHDPNVFQVCNGGFEPGSPGEGPCDPATGLCQNSTTETGVACPTNDSNTGASCEFSDANCFNAGKRTTVQNGKDVSYRWPIAACLQNVFQNGDLDFDGTSYVKDWPDGTRNHPSSFEYLGPFTRHGAPYPTVQFETNVGGSEILCNTATGAGCTAQPEGAAFYPFWTLGRPSHNTSARTEHGGCVWNFGNVIRGATVKSFGGTAEYGTPDLARFGGTLTSPPLPNPQFTGACRG